MTVFNRVTSGPRRMEEDKPAYLSTRPQIFCKRDGCAVPDTTYISGDHLFVICKTRGERVTNGNDSSTADDRNLGLHTSTLWYRVQLPDGRTGYLSEVWLQPADRGGLGLPVCS